MSLIETTTILTRIRWKIQDLQHVFITRWRKSCDWLKWLGYKEGNSESHARYELNLAGWFDKDGMYGDMMGHAVMRLIREFAAEGHSGMSASIATNLFKEVSRFKPLTPLTGEEDEWAEPFDENGQRQNKRCSHVFMDADGHAYDIEGKVFREPDGGTYSKGGSHTPVTFPYTPTTEVVEVEASE